MQWITSEIVHNEIIQARQKCSANAGLHYMKEPIRKCYLFGQILVFILHEYVLHTSVFTVSAEYIFYMQTDTSSKTQT